MQQSLFMDEAKERTISASVCMDECTAAAAAAFDVQFEGLTHFERWAMPDVGNDFELGVIVGPSGTGKSLLLREFGTEHQIMWDRSKAIVSQFGDKDTAFNRLTAVGLNSIPSWLKPYHVLSNGEQYRATLARTLTTGAVVDEFTSVVDRNVAKAMAVGVRRLIQRDQLKRIVLATCHYDVLEWLEPDWCFDTAGGMLARGGLRRPKIEIGIHEADVSLWPLFAPYHYLTHKINKACSCYVGVWNDAPIAFGSILPFPNGNLTNAWREHRTVVLPDFQGLGIGVRLSDAVAQIQKDRGRRYFSRTMHPRMGQYRNRSPLWKVVKGSQKTRVADGFEGDGVAMWKYAMDRPAYSHEYTGNAAGT